MLTSLELFAGAGGLALGMSQAGFRHLAVLERDRAACATFRANMKAQYRDVEEWPLHETDVREFDYRPLRGRVNVVSGGPPCQPFSLGGKHQGRLDERDMFPQAVRAIRDLEPMAFVLENVPGLRRESFAAYFGYVILQLQHPEVERQPRESWITHRSRLEQHHSSNKGAATYNVCFDVLNAADYGVPQRRQRVFVVGFRSDLGARWSFPNKTHSEAALIRSKWVDGSYWEEKAIPRRKRPEITFRELSALRSIKGNSLSSMPLRWRTVRDALSGLPNPESQRSDIENHVFVPGARMYPGHTGSLLDLPAKTLKAGIHGVPGGENMFVKSDGSVRYFTVREAARIQSFDDNYRFVGSWTQAMRQLGNAVPVRLAHAVAASVAHSILQLGGQR